MHGRHHWLLDQLLDLTVVVVQRLLARKLLHAVSTFEAQQIVGRLHVVVQAAGRTEWSGRTLIALVLLRSRRRRTATTFVAPIVGLLIVDGHTGLAPMLGQMLVVLVYIRECLFTVHAVVGLLVVALLAVGHFVLGLGLDVHDQSVLVGFGCGVHVVHGTRRADNRTRFTGAPLDRRVGIENVVGRAHVALQAQVVLVAGHADLTPVLPDLRRAVGRGVLVEQREVFEGAWALGARKLFHGHRRVTGHWLGVHGEMARRQEAAIVDF
jgi:hypothetical protein